MAVYRLLQVKFWQDDFILDLDTKERFFYVYLLTCTKTTQCGIYELPKRIAQLETGFDLETIDELLQRFVEYGKILYDPQTKEVYIQNWLRYNRIVNTNIEKCVLRELQTVKSKTFIHIFLQQCLEEGFRIPLLVEEFGMPAPEIPVSEEPKVEEREEAGEERSSAQKVYAFYQQHFGTLSAYSAEELNGWIENLSEELVLKALQIAYEQNKCKLAYVKGILRDWHKKGYTQVNEVEAAAVKFRNKEPRGAEETETFLEECEAWEKNRPSEEELQRFLEEGGWKP